MHHILNSTTDVLYEARIIYNECCVGRELRLFQNAWVCSGHISPAARTVKLSENSRDPLTYIWELSQTEVDLTSQQVERDNS